MDSTRGIRRSPIVWQNESEERICGSSGQEEMARSGNFEKRKCILALFLFHGSHECLRHPERSKGRASEIPCSDVKTPAGYMEREPQWGEGEKDGLRLTHIRARCGKKTSLVKSVLDLPTTLSLMVSLRWGKTT